MPGPFYSTSPKPYPFECKADLRKNQFEGHANTFGHVDHDRDRALPGCFSKHLTANMAANLIKILYQHNPYEPIGRPLRAQEDSTGLDMAGQVSETVRGKDCLILLRDGVIDRLSIGFRKDNLVSRYHRQERIRDLIEVDVRDLSPVTWASNELSRVTDVKGLGADIAKLLHAPSWNEWLPMDLAAMVMAATKKVVSYQDFDLAGRDREWDAAAAEARVRAWADAAEGPNAKYRRAFMWYDPSQADQFGGYKLQIADVIDGKLQVIPKAIFAVAGVLGGARGGVKVPEADKAALRRQVARYYSKMSTAFEDPDLVAPWKGELVGLVTKTDLGVLVQARDIIDGLLEAWQVEAITKRGDQELAGQYLSEGIHSALARFQQLADRS